MAAFAASCNFTLEKCQHSLKSSFKRVKSQIQKGANPEKAARHGYEQGCEYLEIWNKAILIQQRTLACLSSSLAHILQRELYTMGNTGLLRREAEMTLLIPHLGDMRCQELRNSPFWPSSLFKSQLVKEGEDFLLKKGTSKDAQGFGPYQNKPFRGPHNKKRGSYRKHPYGGNSSQSCNQSFSSGRRKPNFRGSKGLGGEDMETPPPNDSSKASISPPVRGRLCSFRRDWQTNKCIAEQNREMGVFQVSMLEAMKSLRDEMHSIKKASESDVVQTSDSLPKAGPSKQPDPITTQTSDHSDAQPMDTDHYGPTLPPKSTQSVQSEHAFQSQNNLKESQKTF